MRASKTISSFALTILWSTSAFAGNNGEAAALNDGVMLDSQSADTPLTLGDDDSVEVSLPFEVNLCGQTYTSVFVNSNGNLTFGEGSTDFSESTSDLLAGPARLAGLWDDLNPTAGGSVFFSQTADTFTVTYDGVPEFSAIGANTFSIELRDASSNGGVRTGVSIRYGSVTATDGLVGLSCGPLYASGDEQASDLSAASYPVVPTEPAFFEIFTGTNPFDLDGIDVVIDPFVFPDVFEPNNNPLSATAIDIPFNSGSLAQLTAIAPAGADVDYFWFFGRAGTTIVAEVTRGQLDTVLGIFAIDDAGQATLLAVDDNSGEGQLSRIEFEVQTSGIYEIAVSTADDLDFDGDGLLAAGNGRYVLDVQEIYGLPIELGDDTSVEVRLPFTFPFQGSSYDSVFVNSNGNLTFGEGSTDFSESVSELLSGPPRIAALWDDLSPNNGGLVTVFSDANEVLIGFYQVPEFSSTGANTFFITLFSDGTYEIDYGEISATDGLVGTSAGGGAADPGGTDLSATSNAPASGTTYELFNASNAFDLAQDFLSFF